METHKQISQEISENAGIVLGQFHEILFTVDTEIKVRLIPRKYSVAFAFVLMLIRQMILHIHVHIDTSPQISHSLSLS